MMHLSLTFFAYRLGITQFLIKGGIARLEEVRGSNGELENLYVRVSIHGFVQVHRQ